MEANTTVVEAPSRRIVIDTSPLPLTEWLIKPHRSWPLTPLLAGLLLTLAQLALAIFILAPDAPLSQRYTSLLQHDSFWFMNIVDRGYQTIVPPINHKVMEISNVGFFPAYPVVASLLQTVFRLDTSFALLLGAQLAAWGFWTYFFLFCRRWKLPRALTAFGALVIAAHPAAFYLIAGYSESLFLMTLLGFIYWSGEESRKAQIFAALHGMVMSATRIVGIPCALYPLLRRMFVNGQPNLRDRAHWLRSYLPAALTALVAMSGAGLFFLYCQFRWGRWDIYMLTQSAGWNIDPDYLAVFRPSSYRWLIPALNNPTEVSQMAMTLGALLFVVVAIVEVVAAVRHQTQWQRRIGIYFCALVVYYLSVSGVASIEMESMLRYQFCCHALIVLAFLHFLRQFEYPPVLLRAVATATTALVCAASLSVQGWYLWNFMRGNWVA